MMADMNSGIADARKTKRFGWLLGRWMTDAKLFHFAPVRCLKYRGLDYRDEELRRKVTEGALANYVVNSDEEGIDHGLKTRPLLAFVVCYVTAHYVLDLLKKGCPNVEFLPVTIQSAEDAKKVVADDKDMDGYLVCLLGIWNGGIVTIASSGKPTLLVDYLFGGSGEFLISYAAARRSKLNVSPVRLLW